MINIQFLPFSIYFLLFFILTFISEFVPHGSEKKYSPHETRKRQLLVHVQKNLQKEKAKGPRHLEVGRLGHFCSQK